MNQTWENTKKPSFGPSGRQFFFFCFKNLAPSVTRYHGQLSPCTEKTYDPILRKLSDGRADRQTDGQKWFHRTLSDYRRASKMKKYNKIISLRLQNSIFSYNFFFIYFKFTAKTNNISSRYFDYIHQEIAGNDGAIGLLFSFE